MLNVSGLPALAAAANSSCEMLKRSTNGTSLAFATSAIAAEYFFKFSLVLSVGGWFGSLLFSAASGATSTTRGAALPL